MEKKESAKERILRVATDLFYREGIRAVGIDRIILESGVAKASFYRSFATKDDLVVAFLEQRHRSSMARIDEAERRYPDSPVDQLLFLFESLADRLAEPDFRGCPYMNTSVEFPDADHPGHRKAAELRQQQWDRVTQIAERAGARDPMELSVQLRMMYSGATMIGYMNKTDFRREYMLSAVRTLIEKQLA
ncbi:TetR/AcrR family transcriptional regulator [Paenibacillus sp. P26]|nr:TetR/AcrR family transcriptional regulator [Paenibacillus sp. P26]UUZ93777.1 TetR/AcrR family transcriptional regulator [Paenibacillus sp. P25]